eukprot:3306677-Amphidinium_carterae.1
MFSKGVRARGKSRSPALESDFAGHCCVCMHQQYGFQLPISVHHLRIILRPAAAEQRESLPVAQDDLGFLAAAIVRRSTPLQPV